MVAKRYERLEQLKKLDPDRNFHRIYKEMVLFEFYPESIIGFQLAFIRPFALPSISRIVAGTGEVTQRLRKRADDTALLMFELIHHGFDHPRGKEALRRLNSIHRVWRAPGAPAGTSGSNPDFVYVLATLLFPPIDFIDRYGWRPLSDVERQAAYRYYRELGRHMGVHDIPESYGAFRWWFDDYEAEHLAYTPPNAELMRSMHAFVSGRAHPLLRPLLNSGVDTLLEDHVREAIGLRRPPLAVRIGVDALLRGFAVKRRFEEPSAKSPFEPGEAQPSYPDGYEIDQLGPGDQTEAAGRLMAGHEDAVPGVSGGGPVADQTGSP